MHRNIVGAKTCPGAKTVQYPGSIPISDFAPRYARPTHGILLPEPEPLRHAKSQDLQSQEVLFTIYDRRICRIAKYANRGICAANMQAQYMHSQYMQACGIYQSSFTVRLSPLHNGRAPYAALRQSFNTHRYAFYPLIYFFLIYF